MIAEFADHIATVHQALAMISKAIHEEVRVRRQFARA
jgi:hypothetical protein